VTVGGFIVIFWLWHRETERIHAATD